MNTRTKSVKNIKGVLVLLIATFFGCLNALGDHLDKAYSHYPEDIDSVLFYLDVINPDTLDGEDSYDYFFLESLANYYSGSYQTIKSSLQKAEDSKPLSTDEKTSCDIWLLQSSIFHGDKKTADQILAKYSKEEMELSSHTRRFLMNSNALYGIYSKNNSARIDSIQNYLPEKDTLDQYEANYPIRVNVAEMLFESGRYAESSSIILDLVAHLDSKLESKDDQQYQELLAFMARNANDKIKAISSYEKVFSKLEKTNLVTEKSSILYHLIPLYLETGDLVSARSSCQQFMIQTKKLNSAFWINRSVIYYAMLEALEGQPLIAKNTLHLVDLENDIFPLNKDLVDYTDLLIKATHTGKLDQPEYQELQDSIAGKYSINQVELLVSHLSPESYPASLSETVNSKIVKRDAILNSLSFIKVKTESSDFGIWPLLVSISAIALIFIYFSVSQKNKIDQPAGIAHNNVAVKPSLEQRAISVKKDYPSITKSELIYIKYVFQGKPNREVAEKLNVTPGSVTKARYRIKKKLLLDKDMDLDQFLLDKY